VVRFNEYGEPQQMLSFDAPTDSLTFGKTGTDLEGLLFISTNSDANGGELLMVDTHTLKSVVVASGGSRGDIVKATSDGRLLLSQSEQIDVLRPVIAPEVAFTNPSPNAIVALPHGSITVTFDQDMFTGAATDTASVLNPRNFVLTGKTGGTFTPQSVRYDAATHSATLDFGTLAADNYELDVLATVESTSRLALAEGYEVDFTAVSDFSPFVDIDFSNTRYDRANQTISFDLSLTNETDYDLLLPLTLLLTPTGSFTSTVPGAISQQRETGAYLLDLSHSLTNGRLKAGASITGETITVYNPDALRFDYVPSVFALPYANEAPIFTGSPLRTARVGQAYTFTATAQDPDGNSLTYLLYAGPEGMSVDAQTGVFTWMPGEGAASLEEVILQVYDARGARSTQRFEITVAGGNHAPVFEGLPLEIKGAEGQKLQLVLRATDADKDNLTVWADQLPPGASFDPKTKTLTWTPGYTAAGTYEDVRFFVSDGTTRTVQTTTFLITPTNQVPSLTPLVDRTIREGESIRLQLQGQDPEGAELTYFSNFLPGGSRLDPATGIFEWTPTYFQAGSFKIPFMVSDGKQSATQTLSVSVLNVNAAPVFEGLSEWTVVEGQSVRFRAFAFDPDNPDFVPQERNQAGVLTLQEGSDASVRYSVSGLPAGATFDAQTAILSWATGFSDAGTYDVTFTATDDGDGTGTAKTTVITVPITVLDINRAPEIMALTQQTLQRGENKTILVKVTDADGDDVSIKATGLTGVALPEFITFTDNGDRTATLAIAPGAATGSGDYVVNLVATDTTGAKVNYEFVITVNAPNDAPVIRYVGDKVAVVGEPLSFNVFVGDANQDALSYGISGLPSGAVITKLATYGMARVDWTPTAADIGAFAATLTVSDSGNGVAAQALTSESQFAVKVRSSNQRPTLSPIGNVNAREGQPLTILLNGSDADGDKLTYLAENLPDGAVLNPETGALSWTPNAFQAGTYNNIVLTVSDGHSQQSETIAISVANVNQAPVLVPLPPQAGKETVLMQFSLAAGDGDADALVYSARSALPAGARLNPVTGAFIWTPTYEQAGEYTLQFAATDSSGAQSVQDVFIRIANVNRAPELTVSSRNVAIGETLNFVLGAKDADQGSNLSFSAQNLPQGATLNAATGAVSWQPTPGQIGEYLVSYAVSDGVTSVAKNAVITVTTEPIVPVVTLDMTPNFPVTPGQAVRVRAIADSLSEIESIAVTVNGKAVSVDAQGQVTVTPDVPGRYEIVATVVDEDGRIGTTTTTLKVKDPTDQLAPEVKFSPTLGLTAISQPTDLVGSVKDLNLDEWTLEIAVLGSDLFRTLATGTGTLSNAAISQLNPNALANGFYQLRLKAKDIGDRTSEVTTEIEVNSAQKANQYLRQETGI
jgi:hypothetical protein